MKNAVVIVLACMTFLEIQVSLQVMFIECSVRWWFIGTMSHIWKRWLHSENALNVFRNTGIISLDLKTQQSRAPVRLDLCLRKTLSRKSRD